MVAVIRICKNTLVINLSYIALFIDDVKKLKLIYVKDTLLSQIMRVRRIDHSFIDVTKYLKIH